MNHKMIQVTFVYESFNHDLNQHKTVLYTSYNIIFHDTSFSTLLQVGFQKESIDLLIYKRKQDIYLVYQPVPYGLHFERTSEYQILFVHDHTIYVRKLGGNSVEIVVTWNEESKTNFLSKKRPIYFSVNKFSFSNVLPKMIYYPHDLHNYFDLYFRSLFFQCIFIVYV